MQNPFTLTFGKSPLEPVERPVQTNEIVDAFTAESVNQQMFIITGVRGSGKTVMMTEIARRLREKENWVVIEINPSTDLLQAMLAKLNSNKVCAAIIKSAKIDLSFFGFGVAIEGVPAITDAETAIITILEKMKKSGKRLLVTIDEVTNNDFMKVFAGSFQIFVRQDLPVFLSGFPEEIGKLSRLSAQRSDAVRRRERCDMQNNSACSHGKRLFRLLEFADAVNFYGCCPSFRACTARGHAARLSRFRSCRAARRSSFPP